MEELEAFKKNFPNVDEGIARSLLDPANSWNELTIDCLGWIEQFPNDKYLTDSFQKLFESIEQHHLIWNGELNDNSVTVLNRAISILKVGMLPADIPYLVSDLIKQSMDSRYRIRSALKYLICCVLDFEYGRFDAALYAAMYSLSITVGCGVYEDEGLQAFALTIFEDTYKEARELVLKENESMREIPEKCPISPGIFLDEGKFREAYGRRLHVASLTEPDDVVERIWKSDISFH